MNPQNQNENPTPPQPSDPGAPTSNASLNAGQQAPDGLPSTPPALPPEQPAGGVPQPQSVPQLPDTSQLFQSSVPPQAQTPTNLQPQQGMPPAQQPLRPEVHQEFGQTVQYGIQKPPRPYKKILIITSAVVILIAGVAGIVVLTKSSTQKSASQSTEQSSATDKEKIEKKTVEIPDDWVDVPTELGFSIMAPEGWAAAVPTESTIANLKSNNSLVSDPNAEASTGLLPPENSVSVSSQERTDAGGQKAFEAGVTKLDEESLSVLESLGIKKEDIKVSSKKLIINDTEWLEVSTEIPGQFSRSLYLWDGDRAISVMVVAASKEKLDELSNKYLYPVGASITADSDVDTNTDADTASDTDAEE